MSWGPAVQREVAERGPLCGLVWQTGLAERGPAVGTGMAERDTAVQHPSRHIKSSGGPDLKWISAFQPLCNVAGMAWWDISSPSGSRRSLRLKISGCRLAGSQLDPVRPPLGHAAAPHGGLGYMVLSGLAPPAMAAWRRAMAQEIQAPCFMTGLPCCFLPAC